MCYIYHYCDLIHYGKLRRTLMCVCCHKMMNIKNVQILVTNGK